ncbi:hypothetical protein AB1E84_001606 [Yersinia enterocolitica]|uniref:hypothetical protein n=1 Tax=Yersinia enterocolitica TaxID=630 RepID=UPI0029A6C7BE|nr:hypothetical protein [Yersinia enterocolitica]HEI6835743.1 hypothetical protein [Yersinia enterocolitica]HEN3358541.1 hypothetical protein [Yersinia enterocolitica]
MKKYLSLITIASIYASSAFADVRCGEFTLTSSNDGFMHINGIRPETQKLTFLKQKDDYDNVKFEWIVNTKQPGRWLGMEYIKRNGNNRILNVQLLQASMDNPRLYGTFDCIKIN